MANIAVKTDNGGTDSDYKNESTRSILNKANRESPDIIMDAEEAEVLNAGETHPLSNSVAPKMDNETKQASKTEKMERIMCCS